jgi:hypothetical protein
LVDTDTDTNTDSITNGIDTLGIENSPVYMEIQRFWDQVDLHDFRHYTKQLTCKIEDVIAVRGLATIN